MFSCILNLVSTNGFGSTRMEGFVDLGSAFGLVFPTAMVARCLSNLMTAATLIDDRTRICKRCQVLWRESLAVSLD